MKKILLLSFLAVVSLTGFASKRILFQQDFNFLFEPSETGWILNCNAELVGTDCEKYLQLSNNGNSRRAAEVKWGEDLFFDNGTSLLINGEYDVTYDFCLQMSSTATHEGSCFTVFTNGEPSFYSQYRTGDGGCWEKWIFDMSQPVEKPCEFVVNSATLVETSEDGTETYGIDYSNPITFVEGEWYSVSLKVNLDDRKVYYKIISSTTGETVVSGVREVPQTWGGENISDLAQGLYVYLSNYLARYDIDNIMVSFNAPYDYANIPTVNLCAIGGVDASGNETVYSRSYRISFIEGETLHVEGTDGSSFSAEYSECGGSYLYETTTGGILKAWTTCGTATSDIVEKDIVCSQIDVPAADVKLVSVSEGYGKTISLTCDNSSMELRPEIFMDYEYISNTGEKLFSVEEAQSGSEVTVDTPGILYVRTYSFGYGSGHSEFVNNTMYENKRVYDFARMTEEDIVAAGFPGFNQVLNSSRTYGFENWTARKRLYYNLPESYERVYPFGFVSEDNTTNVIHYSVIDNASKEEQVSGTGYFDDLIVFPPTSNGNRNVCMMQHIGLYNDQSNSPVNNYIYIYNLEETDFVVVNSISSYGANSCHPTVTTDDEYYAVLAGEDTGHSVAEEGELVGEGVYRVKHGVYRIDTAVTKITVLGETIPVKVEELESTEVSDDEWYYSIDGIRMKNPTRPGLYIHKEKKIILK